jgi:hypothetical protein
MMIFLLYILKINITGDHCISTVIRQEHEGNTCSATTTPLYHMLGNFGTPKAVIMISADGNSSMFLV